MSVTMNMIIYDDEYEYQYDECDCWDTTPSQILLRMIG